MVGAQFCRIFAFSTFSRFVFTITKTFWKEFSKFIVREEAKVSSGHMFVMWITRRIFTIMQKGVIYIYIYIYIYIFIYYTAFVIRAKSQNDVIKAKF